MTQVLHPSLYQINTRVWLTSLSERLGRPARLDDLPDAELDRLAGMGFDRVWFKDSLSPACYIREGTELLERGLYLDLQPWSYHVFDLKINP